MKACRLSVPVIVLFGLLLNSFAQDDLPAAVGVPAAVKTPVENIVQPAVGAASAAAPKKETVEKWGQELLRDPFWPIGYFPQDWKKKTAFQSEPDLDGSGWKAASAKIQISGTSRLGGRAAAIINGELKSTGDQVEILHEGKTYQWQIVGMDADGRIQLKKLGIR